MMMSGERRKKMVMGMSGSMHTYKMGDKITDSTGNQWIIGAIWQYDNWMCFGLLAEHNKDWTGGYRVKLYEVIWN